MVLLKHLYAARMAFYRMANQIPSAVVICGPSGSGKSTLLKKLFEEFPDKFGFSVSHTTRNPRKGEVHKEHYHFTTKDEMQAAIERGDFLESAEYNNNLYGTSKAAVEEVNKSGKVCVLDIEIQGVKQIKQSDLKPLYIFVKPPSLNVLEQRLRERGTETEESLKRRLAIAAEELKYGETPGNFNYVIVNDSLDKAYAELKSFVMQEMEKFKLTDTGNN